MTALGLVLAALIGLALGVLGGGGSILTVPILVYILGIAPKPAIAMSLAVVAVTAGIGAAGHWRHGQVRPGVAVPFGLVAMAGAWAGAQLAVSLSGTAQLTLFAVVMLAAARFMLAGRPVHEAPARRVPPWVLGLLGLAVGVLTGLVGVGGGFLIVPSLVLVARLPMKTAIGTSLVVIAANAAAGLAGHLRHVAIPWRLLVPFTGIAVLGVLVGTRLAHRLPAAALRRAFGMFLLLMGLLILAENMTG